jgi:hypothetical protein
LAGCTTESLDPNYDPTEITVAVSITGNGGGRVTGPQPVAIQCVKSPDFGTGLGDCTITFVDAGAGGTFDLFSTPDSISTFVAWSGDCAGPTCRLSFPPGRDTTFNVTARFNLQPPVATIVSPSAGASFYADQRVDFEGAGVDAAGKPVRSPGGGFGWSSSLDGVLCAETIPGECARFGRILSPGSHAITLTVKDDAGTPTSTSVNIVVRPEILDDPPQATIDYPRDGDSLDTGQSIYFAGNALDHEEGRLPDSALVWSSSLDGVFAVGQFVRRALRSAGTHVISLVATDSGGKSDTASVTIYLRQAAAPASISGVVTSNGTPIAGATLDLYVGNRLTTTTDNAGRYAFTFLQPDNYRVDLSPVPNVMFPSLRQTVTLASGENATLDFAGVAACVYDRPLAWYALNGNGIDSSGNGLHGTLPDTMTAVADHRGVPGAALLFDGVRDQIDLGDVLNIGLPFSLAAWVYMPNAAFGGFRSIFASDDQPGWYAGFFMGTSSTTSSGNVQVDRPSISFADSGAAGPGHRRTLEANTPITANTWTHIVATVRGPNDMTLYMNAQPVPATYSGTGGPIRHSLAPARIGSYSLVPSNQHWLGALDDLRVYSCSLDQAQVTTLYERQ